MYKHVLIWYPSSVTATTLDICAQRGSVCVAGNSEMSFAAESALSAWRHVVEVEADAIFSLVRYESTIERSRTVREFESARFH